MENSTVDSPNRVRDQIRVECDPHTSGLKEFGNPNTLFYTRGGVKFAKGYVRVVYGDHGPYVEFTPDMILERGSFRKKSDLAWYDESFIGRCKLYWQKKDVKMLPNPPVGKYSVRNNRLDGYADYKVGMVYVSPDDIDTREF